MFKKILNPFFLTFLIICTIAILPYLTPKKPLKVPSDNKLREEAISHNLLPVPKEREKLLKLLSTPSNPLTKERVALGKELFFDPRLSLDKSVTCASCHILSEGGDDNLPTAIGYLGRANPQHLNSPTVLNAALQKYQFWDGRARSVEEQAGGPIQSSFEMNMKPKALVNRLKNDPAIVLMFDKAFGKNSLNFTNIRKAIGAYERTLLTRGPFDRFLDGNNSAISKAAKRGLTLFMERGCKGCHTGISIGGQFIKRFPLRSYLEDYLGINFHPKLSIKRDSIPFDNIGGFRGKT